MAGRPPEPTGEQPRSVTVLGSTGSVGRSTVDLLRRHPGRFRVEALTAHRNVALLAEQASALDARLAVIGDETLHAELRARLAGTATRTAAGANAVDEAAEHPADWVMAAIVGIRGLAPALAACRRGALVAFANKECLVSAGPLILDAARRGGATLLPVDSEHNAIFQVLHGESPAAVERLILTASGGPFRSADAATMARATVAQTVAHPVWSMGAKISVDSATMMNKGLEIIEAALLFDMPGRSIEVLVHPQSIVHSLVAFVDGSVLAQLGTPDMRTPIAHALAWPRRIAGPSPRLDLAAIGRLDFEPPDPVRFPALAMARAALDRGGTAPAILNAANEAAVAAFLAGRIGLPDVAGTVARVMEGSRPDRLEGLEDVWAADRQGRALAEAVIAAG